MPKTVGRQSPLTASHAQMRNMTLYKHSSGIPERRKSLDSRQASVTRRTSAIPVAYSTFSREASGSIDGHHAGALHACHNGLLVETILRPLQST